jgi:hypothetical protein
MGDKITNYPRKTINDPLDEMDISTFLGDGYRSEKQLVTAFIERVNGMAFDRTLDNAELLTLASANGGEGVELLPVSGANTIYEITSDIYFIFDVDGAFTSASLQMRNFGNITPLTTTTTLDGTMTLPDKFVSIVKLQENFSLSVNKQLMLKATAEQTLLTSSTLRILFNYKILNV